MEHRTTLKHVRESLADYLRRTMFEKKLTFKEVEQRSNGKISAGGLNDLLKGRTTNPTVLTLKALARGLGVPEDEIFAVARGKSVSKPEANEIRLLSYFHNLPENYQEDAVRIVGALSQGRGVHSEAVANGEYSRPVITAKLERTKGGAKQTKVR